MMMEEKIINAKGLVMGRLASSVSKMLLKNEKVTIVNAEEAIITGHREAAMSKFSQRIQIKTYTDPLKGPRFVRMPDRILRASIKGMLPIKRARGREAVHNLKVFIGVPESLEGKETTQVKDAQYKGTRKFLKLREVSKILGKNVEYGEHK